MTFRQPSHNAQHNGPLIPLTSTASGSRGTTVSQPYIIQLCAPVPRIGGKAVTWKAEHRERYVSREDVFDALIADGWIEGRRLILDDARTMRLISPRKQQAWPQSYQLRAAGQEAEGRLHPAGRGAVTQGQESGLWHGSGSVDPLIDPDDLIQALEATGGPDGGLTQHRPIGVPFCAGS